MNKLRELFPPEDVSQICHPCATARGWKPTPFAVGVWLSECNDCGERKPCTAPRDYLYSATNPLGR
mgnify:FL=1